MQINLEQFPHARACQNCDSVVKPSAYPGRWEHIETGSVYCEPHEFNDERRARPTTFTIRELP